MALRYSSRCTTLLSDFACRSHYESHLRPGADYLGKFAQSQAQHVALSCNVITCGNVFQNITILIHTGYCYGTTQRCHKYNDISGSCREVQLLLIFLRSINSNNSRRSHVSVRKSEQRGAPSIFSSITYATYIPVGNMTIMP
jgi:hypothetical protein